MSDIMPSPLSYPELIDRISDCLTQGKVQAARQVNSILLKIYWQEVYDRPLVIAPPPSPLSIL